MDLKPRAMVMEDQRQKVAGDNPEPVLLTGRGKAHPVATAAYALIAAGHVGLLIAHRSLSYSDGRFFASLASLEVALALESAIFALGAFRAVGGTAAQVLTMLGRVRLLGAALLWPWLLPWLAEISCRCGVVEPNNGGVWWLNHSAMAAITLTGFFALREVSFFAVGEPAAAMMGKAVEELDPGCMPSAEDVAGCLPGQALFWGQFRLDKQDLEETGRYIFVPARERQGLYIGAGLALLASLIVSLFFVRIAAPPPWLLLGGLAAFLGRRWGSLPKLPRPKGMEREEMVFSPWRIEGRRLTCRLGELIWIGCCILELRRCEQQSSWLAACARS
eukprot:TRINITY_DN13697_c0_g1_i2.p1 TRINITY_DN13697_c0_g1~~TRINITY_DN13697_c0_g1_i2.p1  ORF type:complete len:333 (+),score=54.70 TRINITY_DN13697_c0_g1_i2:109-1107(+)